MNISGYQSLFDPAIFLYSRMRLPSPSMMVWTAPAPARFMHLPLERCPATLAASLCARVRSELWLAWWETVDTGEGYFAKARVSIAKLRENHLQRLRGPLSFQEE